jgi:glycosyltransferase involved in cell wall biosynthesis
MKIAVYANEIAQEGSFGVKIYSREILQAILRLDRENRYILYSSSDISGFFGEEAFFSLIKPKKLWAFTVFASRIKKDRPDVLFLPIQIYPFWKKSSIKTVVVVHDLAFLLFPGHFTWIKRRLLSFHTKRAILLSDRVIVPSGATKKDILKFYKVEESKISVIPHGFNANLLKMAQQGDSRVLELTNGKPYILFVGSIQPRKNLIRLVEAFEEVAKEESGLKLVICGGKGWMYEEIYAKIAKSQFSNAIIMTGDVSDDLLASLYKNALFFVFPSLYEGFGLPVIEAMSFGLPVVCANNSSISEIAGDATLCFDEYSVSDMAEKMLILCRNEELWEELSAKSLQRASLFSWDKAAEETVEIIEKA